MYTVESSKGLGYTVMAIIVVLYLSYAGLHLLQYFIRRRYGKTREIEGVSQPIETYNSRLFSIFASAFVFIIAFVSIIRFLGFDSLLEVGGAVGIVGVFLALTQNTWAPDMFSGLIILNSSMVEVGDVIEFNDGDRTLGVVYKTKVFHTEILNLINNHRIMIKNARLREQTIHNLSKFASAKGLREQLHFKIDYAEDETNVRKMFQAAFEIATKIENTDIESQYPIEIGIVETGDHAVEWCVYYYTKNVKGIIATRQYFREEILKTSKQMNISLATPLRHLVEKST
ncbi:MAG: mechanosensitive ion channel family protein [Gammaproteobacteria bacterium]|nr:mechanosensitive ion channel family protein [Gammaproteobacteria bacterium]